MVSIMSLRLTLKTLKSVSFLHPYGPAQSFRYPSAPDILIISATDILTKVSPRTVTCFSCLVWLLVVNMADT